MVCTKCAARRQKKYNLNNKYAAVKRYKERHKSQIAARRLAKYRSDPAKILLARARWRARAKGVEFSLNVSDVVIPATCPVLGIRLELGGRGRGYAAMRNSPTIDRFDNTKGYTPDNIRVISWRANSLKADATVQEMEAVLRYMKGQ